jgi:cyclic beta-1,2-glucan synthetase
LLDQTYWGSVHRQIAFAGWRGVPWGMSESAYNLRDHAQTYQYRSFGVPDLALKRGLDADLVVAPYATALAAMVQPARALANLRQLERFGALGPYGFRDALDFTRPDPGKPYAVVDTYMAHHIGMGLVALSNALTACRWQHRFHADPLVRAAELLLYERIPRRVLFQETQVARAEASLPDPELERPAVRRFDTAGTPQPRVALLGRLPYTIMVTNAGSGYSRYGALAVNRWRADGTTDASGQFCYLRDLRTGRVWSSAHQPTGIEADSYQAALATDRVIFHRLDGPFETRTEVTVVPDDSAEVRRVTVTNNGAHPAEVELTSYGEWVLAPPDADRAHPAFGNLFVETEWHDWCQALTACRRPRSVDEARLWGVHVIAVAEAAVGEVEYESDRARFLGRGRSPRSPQALDPGQALSRSTGAVLDPIFALRTRLHLAPGQSASVSFTTGVASSAEGAFDLADRYRDPRAAQRALDLAWTTAQIELRELRTSSEEAALYQKLASDLFFSDPQLRAPEAELRRNVGTQAQLWSIGLSGDWPIVLATLDSTDGLPTLEELLKAHQYWRRRGMTVDLVILNVHPPSYLQTLGDRIGATVRSSSEAGLIDQPGGVFLRRNELLRPEELAMLRATARVHVPCDGRSLAQIVDRGGLLAVLREPEELAASPRGPLHRLQAGLADRLRVPTPLGTPTEGRAAPPGAAIALAPPAEAGEAPPLRGRLAPDGAYELSVEAGGLPPAPWSNVVANERGGFLVTERGGGFCWAGSSYFYRLTPWHNDPVSDPVSDVLYLRDLDSGEAWTPTPGPMGADGRYQVRHAQGESRFQLLRGELRSELTLGLADGEAVKVARLVLVNAGVRPRRLSVTAYVEWTLGTQREHTQHQVSTDFDAARGTLFARNTFDPQFSLWSGFCTMVPAPERHGADRRDFLGRNGTVAAPRGLQMGASGRTGASLDPCAVLQRTVVLGPGERQELTVYLGAAPSRTEAEACIDRLREPEAPRVEVRTLERWQERLSVLQVKTPEPSFDALLNRWLLYQTLSCRMWARSALYQSGGAYGFRDQLQDSMALVYAEPELARAHLLRAAGRQFVEGDVQHWWHPESGRGVRTRISDDLVWLPFVVDHHVRVTGDAGVLAATAPFLAQRPLKPEEAEAYELPAPSGEAGTLYEHCRRALRRACTRGEHGLPLIGSGDWNDGMNRVGAGGKGESVWLAWFLVRTLRGFAVHAEARGDAEEAAWMRGEADRYLQATEDHAWDGAWYRRAFFDDGTPLGSAQNVESKIDSIAQSWSVLSGAGRADRARQAMGSLRHLLVDRQARVMKLLDPPFDKALHDPGYIRGYLPGVRENGAQYTHAALWAVLAMAEQGDAELAFEHFQMLNPLTHTRSAEEVAVYQAEPYVVSADVYTAPGHLGRGGWSWYTGSASWMYRVGLEGILGFRKEGNTLRLVPRAPGSWARYDIDYRHGRSRYRIAVERETTNAAGTLRVDGVVQPGGVVVLVDDGAEHRVQVSR